ncbi:MAG: tannase/feruloyl esterase family alpha/beta hydrolase [Rhodospirillaceae bacterium]|nr:tannase/feruloyl esterase family alpha/beta hydrolase [Rhodospirillaceae bacterium]
MLRGSLFGLIALAPALSLAQVPGANPGQAKCQAVMAQDFTQLPDAATGINGATLVAPERDLPEYCRIQGVIAPDVVFELRLPTTTWNGKFLMQGCGGMCGILNMAAAEDSLVRGYAVVNTDMGHTGAGFIANWAYNDLQAEVDFGYRATHVVAVAAKAIVGAYYGKPPAYSYFNGCSTGGRQGMVEAQRFPADFDGIVSGAPVLNEIGDGTLHLLWSARANAGPDGKPILDARKLPKIRDAVIAKCDALDGVTDNVLQDPRRCGFKPEDMQCKGADKADCLTTAEVGVVNRIYNGAHNSKGEKIFPGGMSRGSEYEWSPPFVGLTQAGGTKTHGAILNRNSMIYQFTQYLTFFNDPGPSYNPMTFDWDRDPSRLMLTETIYNAQNPDLRRFKAAGKKLILYHGWDDAEIPPGLSVDYYETATNTMGGPAATREFFRLFMIPGMAHCRRGVGADGFDPAISLEAWVEKDQAPDSILTHKMAKDQPYAGLPRLRFPLKREDYTWTRPVYAYPDVAAWNGQGDWQDPANWIKTSPSK